MQHPASSPFGRLVPTIESQYVGNVGLGQLRAALDGNGKEQA